MDLHFCIQFCLLNLSTCFPSHPPSQGRGRKGLSAFIGTIVCHTELLVVLRPEKHVATRQVAPKLYLKPENRFSVIVMQNKTGRSALIPCYSDSSVASPAAHVDPPGNLGFRAASLTAGRGRETAGLWIWPCSSNARHR